jgi:hypothetical protein
VPRNRQKCVVDDGIGGEGRDRRVAVGNVDSCDVARTVAGALMAIVSSSSVGIAPWTLRQGESQGLSLPRLTQGPA